jgi:hypothetical protein
MSFYLIDSLLCILGNFNIRKKNRKIQKHFAEKIVIACWKTVWSLEIIKITI